MNATAKAYAAALIAGAASALADKTPRGGRRAPKAETPPPPREDLRRQTPVSPTPGA